VNRPWLEDGKAQKQCGDLHLSYPEPVVLAPKRKRTPAPESDPTRDWLIPYLEEPTPNGVHEILGTFVLREGGWRALHTVFLGGAAFVTALGALYLLFPESFRFDGFQVAKALVAASPFLVLSFWLRLRRRRLRRAREAYAEAVADALTDIVARLDHTRRSTPASAATRSGALATTRG
jgi:hypothetical protein